jgi:hypothetical protein
VVRLAEQASGSPQFRILPSCWQLSGIPASHSTWFSDSAPGPPTRGGTAARVGLQSRRNLVTSSYGCDESPNQGPEAMGLDGEAEIAERSSLRVDVPIELVFDFSYQARAVGLPALV